MIEIWSQYPVWLPSYDCFSTGMCDDRMKTLIDWQEGPFSLLSAVKRISYSCK